MPAAEWIVGGVGLLVVAAIVGLVVWKLQGKERSVKVRWLINIGTLMATGVQASGMWHFFGDVMHMALAYKLVMFPFMEILILAFGLKALEKAEEAGNWFIYAAMLWVLALSSGGMSASDSSGFREGLFRILIASIVAVLWTLDLLDLWIKARKKKAEEEGKAPEAIRWRFSPRELGVRLGLATAADSSLADLDANRHLERYLRVVDKRKAVERLIKADPEKSKRLHAKLTRITDDEVKAKARLERHARLHADPSVLMGELGAEAVTQAREHLGIAQVQQALKEAQEETAKQAAEVERLAKLLETERAAAAAVADGDRAELAKALEEVRGELTEVRQRAEAAERRAEEIEWARAELAADLEAKRQEWKAAAESLTGSRAELGQTLTEVREKLAEVRQQAEAADRRADEVERVRRQLAVELEAERRERARIETVREEESAAARSRIAGLERSLDEMRVAVPAAGVPAQRSELNGAAPVDKAKTASESAARSAREAYFAQADQLTRNGADRDHPLLSEHSRTRNEAAIELFKHLGFGDLEIQTLRRYSKSYLDERRAAPTVTDQAPETTPEPVLIDN